MSARMTEQIADQAGQRERIETYLERSGLQSRSPHVVPLTGDASDRRYFRVIVPDAPSFVLSLYTAPFDFDTLSFVNVARLLDCMPVPIPTVLGHADDIGVLALEDLGDVTLQAHLGAATPAEHAARYRQAVALIATLQRRGAELEGPEYVPDGIAFDAKLSWTGLLTKHFIEACAASSSRRRFAMSCAPATVIKVASEPASCAIAHSSRNPLPHQDRRPSSTQDTWAPPTTCLAAARDSHADLPSNRQRAIAFLALKGRSRRVRLSQSDSF